MQLTSAVLKKKDVMQTTRIVRTQIYVMMREKAITPRLTEIARDDSEISWSVYNGQNEAIVTIQPVATEK